MRLPRRWSPTKNSPQPLINMKPIIQTLTAVLLSFGLHLSAEQAPKAQVLTEEQAIEILTKVENFGFGPGKGSRPAWLRKKADWRPALPFQV